MILLTDEENKSQKNQKCYICKKGFSTDDDKKKYHKVRDRFHYTGKYSGAVHSICNLRYKIPKEIPIGLYSGSTYDYHFIIKELAKKLRVSLKTQEKIQRNILLFQYQLKKNDNGKTITHKLEFIDSFTFISTSSSKFVDN